MGVLLVIIALDVIVMILVMRTVWTEPPRKHPSPHPFVLEYASSADAEETEANQSATVENEDETLPVAEEVSADDTDE